MTIHFAGNAGACFGSYTIDTTAGRFDADFVPCAMSLSLGNSSCAQVASAISGATETGWYVCGRVTKYQPGTTALDFPPLWVLDETGALAAQVALSNGSAWLNGWATDGTTGNTAFTGASPWATAGTTGPHIMELHAYAGATGAVFTCSVNGALVASVTIAGKTARNCKTFVMSIPSSDSRDIHSWSEVMLGDEPLSGYRVGISEVTGDGTHTDGTGAYTDVDDYDKDGSAVTLTATGQRRSFAVTRAGTWTPGSVRAIAINGAISSDGTNDMQASIRKGGVDYDSADLGLTASPEVRSIVFNSDPASGLGWGSTDPEDLEFGFEAVT